MAPRVFQGINLLTISFVRQSVSMGKVLTAFFFSLVFKVHPCFGKYFLIL